MYILIHHVTKNQNNSFYQHLHPLLAGYGVYGGPCRYRFSLTGFSPSFFILSYASLPIESKSYSMLVPSLALTSKKGMP